MESPRERDYNLHMLCIAVVEKSYFNSLTKFQVKQQGRQAAQQGYQYSVKFQN